MNREELRQHQEARERLKHDHRWLFEEASALLFREDPMGINFETNSDEYEPEVGTILPRLPNCRSPEDVQRVMHEEFTAWFDSETAGPIQRYREVSVALWELWQRYPPTEVCAPQGGG